MALALPGARLGSYGPNVDNTLGLFPLPAVRLTGQEVLTGTDATVTDFWRWAFSDLRTNALRGVLAEHLVASALGVADETRIEWDGHDVTTTDGVRVEVKSSAFLQSWPQPAPTRHSNRPQQLPP